MERASYTHGVPSWVDLGTADTQTAADFYAALFGWDVLDGPPEAGGYRMCLLRGKPVAGLGPQQNPGPPYWSTYVTVDSADAAADLVTTNGGSVYAPPFDVMTFGRMAVLADPAGAVFSVWEARDHQGAGIVGEPGTFCWAELMTTDTAGAIAFYSAVFGWHAESHGQDPATGYTEFQVGGQSIAGMMTKPDSVPAEVPPFWGVYFAVADTDAAVQRVTELGGAVLMPAMDIDPGRFAVVADPTGAVFNVIAMHGTMS